MTSSNLTIIKIVAPIITALFLQTSAAVWWASSVETRLQALQTATKDRYYRHEAVDRASVVDQRFSSLEESVRILTVDLKESVIRMDEKFEGHYDRIEGKLDKYIFQNKL